MCAMQSDMDPDLLFSPLNGIFSQILIISEHHHHLKDRNSKGEEHMDTKRSVKVEAETILGMLYEYQLAYVSVSHYPCFPFINTLLAQTCMCVFCLHAKVSYRHVLLMILRFFFCSPPLTLSNCHSLNLYLSRHPPLPSAHHHFLSFIIFHYIHSQVCLQKCLCSHPPPLLSSRLYLFLILFYRFLSSRPLIPTH